MDYIKQMKGFRERRKTHPLSANAVAMYLILFEEANEQRFPDSLLVSHSRIQEEISLYDREYRRAREELIQGGYILYSKGNKRAYGVYVLVQLDAVNPAQTCRETVQSTAANPPQTCREMSAELPHDKVVFEELNLESCRETAANPPESVREPAASCPQVVRETGVPSLFIYKHKYKLKHKQDTPPISPAGDGAGVPAGPEKPKQGVRTSSDAVKQRFGRFWAAYPKKQGKGAAEKAFCKIKPSEQLLGQMLEALERAKKCDQWNRDNGQYIPNPATWLTQRRWEDDYTPARTRYQPKGEDELGTPSYDLDEVNRLILDATINPQKLQEFQGGVYI